MVRVFVFVFVFLVRGRASRITTTQLTVHPPSRDDPPPAGTVSDIENEAGHGHVSLEYRPAEVGAVVREEYAVPHRMGILKTFKSPTPLTALNIIHRIMEQRDQYQRRFDKKSKAEDDYVAQKAYVQEA